MVDVPPATNIGEDQDQVCFAPMSGHATLDRHDSNADLLLYATSLSSGPRKLGDQPRCRGLPKG